MRLAGKVAVITGTSPNIGGGIAEGLAGEGAAVACIDALAANADDCAAALRAAGTRAIAIAADITDEHAVTAAFARVAAELGPVDILVNNASGWIGDTFRDVEVDDLGRHANPISAATIDRILAVDARASALMIGELGRRLQRRNGTWGRIVGLTSGGASGFPGEVSYGAAKAAQVNYTMSAATELADLGVTANILHPPVTDTGWVNDGVRQFVAGSRELTHVATPDEVAVVIGWLCTDDARLVSGTVMQLR